MQRLRAVHTCGALRLVGGCTWRYNNVGGVTAGQAPHNSSNVGVVTAGQVEQNYCTGNKSIDCLILCSRGNETKNAGRPASRDCTFTLVTCTLTRISDSDTT